MDEIMEQKIKDLMVEAGRKGYWPVRAVLHMLLSSYRTASQRKFAKHCCDFSTVKLQMKPGVTDNPDEYLDGAGHNEYYH